MLATGGRHLSRLCSHALRDDGSVEGDPSLQRRARLKKTRCVHRAWSLAVIDYRDHITIEAGKRGGKPCVRGLRITVYDVLSYLASGMTVEEVLADFPSMTREDVLACLAYAADREQQPLTVIP